MSYHINKPRKYIPKIAEDQDVNTNTAEELDAPLSADFIKLQRINPPAVSSNVETSKIGIGKASKIGQLLKNPHYNKPKPHRQRKTNKKKSKILANYPNIIKEINDIALKEQEKQISDSFIKPLTDKGIKVNNIRTIYRK